MVGKTKKPDAEEQKRMDTLKNHVPCLPCMLSTMRGVRYAEIHHVTSGGRRMGHRYTYPMCAWHHRGMIDNNWTNQAMIGTYGPSYAKGKRTFVAEYGTENHLVFLTDWLLERFEAQPWEYYNVPWDVRSDLKKRWLMGLA